MQLIRIFLLVLVLLPGSALGESLNIDFGDVAGAFPLGPSFGAASDQTGAWNTIDAVGTTSGLLALDGSTSDVNLTLGPEIVNPDGASGLLTGDLNLLMADFFFESSESDFWFLRIEGLDPGLYDVYVYAPANNSSLQGTGDYSINGVPLSDIPGSGIQNFILRENTIGLPGNYDVLYDLVVTDGSINFESNESSTRFLGLSGVQLVQTSVPEPATGLILASALAALATRRRRA